MANELRNNLNTGIDWNAYSNVNLNGVDVTSTDFIDEIVSEFDLPSSYNKKFQQYDPTGEEHLKSTAALQFETRNLQAGKSVYDLYQKSRQLQSQTGFEGAGVYDTSMEQRGLWDAYSLGNKESKVNLINQIYDIRKDHVKEAFRQAAQLAEMYEG